MQDVKCTACDPGASGKTYIRPEFSVVEKLSTMLKLLVAWLVLQAAACLPMNQTFVNNSKNSDSDKKLVKAMVQSLTSISTNKDLSLCDKCVQELQLGKQIAANNKDLIPEIFTKWCKDNKIEKNKDCHFLFSRNSVDEGFSGSDFANLLTLMDPGSIDGQYFCHFKRSACKLPAYQDVDVSDWFGTKASTVVTPESSGETFNVLHISDHHLELTYQVGAEANCTGSNMCCTPHDTNKNQPSKGSLGYDSLFDGSYYDDAGSYVRGHEVAANTSVWEPATVFGNYQCDSPETLVNSSLKSVADFQKQNNILFDFAIFTGDLVDHQEGKYLSYQSVVDEETAMFRDMKNWLGDVPVYSVMGNHDTFPYGQIAQEASGYENLYTWNSDLMSELWKDYGWFDADEAQQVKQHYCGYSVTTKHGLKIIALNSNTYYQKNFYAYWNMSNPDTFGVLRWLTDELLEAEKSNQRVWLMAHIPLLNGDVLPLPAYVYTQIIKRFSPSTIAGIFFGHTHRDQFTVLYAGDGADLSDPVNFAFISQSVTPIKGHNPGWRYYEVDKQSFQVMNSHNFYTKLNDTYTNGGQEPKWEFLYSAREAYDPQQKWPKDAPLNATFWSGISSQIGADENVAQLYSGYSFRESPETPVCSEGGCKNFQCYTSSFTSTEYDACLKRQKKVRGPYDKRETDF